MIGMLKSSLYIESIFCWNETDYQCFGEKMRYVSKRVKNTRNSRNLITFDNINDRIIYKTIIINSIKWLKLDC